MEKNCSMEFYKMVKKSILKHFDVSQEVMYADFNWDAILDMVKRNKVSFKAIPKYCLWREGGR